jgi:hypothetical protein
VKAHAANRAAADQFAANVLPIVRAIQASGAHDPSRDRRRSQCPRSSHGARRSMAFQHCPQSPRPLR